MKVITYGTFDLFHYGHYNLLHRAKALGDYLVVGISSDEMCLKKGKATVLPLAKRMEIVSNLRFVDEVIIENNMEQKVHDIRDKDIDIFVLGDDYRDVFPKMKECDEITKQGCKVVFLERTPDISTTQLKRKLEKQTNLVNEYGIPVSKEK